MAGNAGEPSAEMLERIRALNARAVSIARQQLAMGKQPTTIQAYCERCGAQPQVVRTDMILCMRCLAKRASEIRAADILTDSSKNP